MYSNFLIFFIIIALYKLIANSYKYWRCSQLMEHYLQWLNGNYSDELIFQSKYEVTKLLSITPDKGLPLTLPTGLGQAYSANHSTIYSYPSKIHPFTTATFEMFAESKGAYKSKILETFNPLYWIELIIWLPKQFTLFLGLNNELKAVKTINILLQTIYWFFAGLKFLGYEIIPLLQHIFLK
ncbi:hypothetical protein [Veillonella sp.]|jgi:hypothetical protein|uniref:hypothetical protein n=1 Tax=Veillonella sp. TaxID=1926307 RepID=UPI00352061F1